MKPIILQKIWSLSSPCIVITIYICYNKEDCSNSPNRYVFPLNSHVELIVWFWDGIVTSTRLEAVFLSLKWYFFPDCSPLTILLKHFTFSQSMPFILISTLQSFNFSAKDRTTAVLLKTLADIIWLSVVLLKRLESSEPEKHY